MQAKRQPPSTLRLFIIGVVALLALGGAGVFGYAVASGHVSWGKPAATAPEQTYIRLCSPQGRPDESAVIATWLRAESFDNDISTEYLMSTHGRQTALKVPGTFIRLHLHLTVGYADDGLSCLQVSAHWPGMPANVDSTIYSYDFTEDVQPTVPLIQNPHSLKILINMDKSLYTPRSSIPRTPLPKGVPITLTFQVSTVHGRLYTSQANESYTFIRVEG